MKLTNRTTKNSLGGLLVTLLILAFTCEAAAQTWTQLSPTGSPPIARDQHTAVYDAATNRMTMYGGFTGGFLSDVWVLANANGQGGTPTWTQLSPTGGPPSARRLHIAVYDPSTNRMTVFGGSTDTGRVNDAWLLTYANGVVNVAVDIKPQSCPNALHVESKHALPVAILGTDSFDVNNIDLNNVYLEGIPPLRSYFEDVSTPFSNGGDDPCFDCTEEGPDGELDLVLKFNKQAVVVALGEVSNGDCVELTLTGQLVDDTPISGSDYVLINKRLHPHGHSSP